MNEGRDSMYQAIRKAVAAGNHGVAPPHPERNGVGWQGAGGDVVERFCQELIAAGGMPHRAVDATAAVDIVLSLIQAKGARRVLLGSGDVLASLSLDDALQRRRRRNRSRGGRRQARVFRGRRWHFRRRLSHRRDG